MIKKEEGKYQQNGKVPTYKFTCGPREENNWTFSRSCSLKPSISEKSSTTGLCNFPHPQLPSGNQYMSTEMTQMELLAQRFQMCVISWLSIDV